MVNNEIEKLGYFFGSCPLYIGGNFRQLSLFPPQDAVVVVDFRGDNEDLESVVKKGLSWAGRRKFVEFGINGIPTDEQKREEIPLQGKYGKMAGKAVKPIHLYRTAAVEAVYLPSQHCRAEIQMKQWCEQKKVPAEIINVWNDDAEDQTKLRGMVGRQVYKANENKEYGIALRALLHHHQQKFRSSRKSRDQCWERWKGQPKPGLLDLKELETIISLPAYSISNDAKGEIDNSIFPNEKIEQAITALAQVAYEIRMNYPCKGNSVRDGLVHKQDYVQLYERAKKQCDEEILRRILANGLGTPEAEEEGDVRFVVAAAIELSHRARPHLPEKYSLASEDYQRMGHLRVEEFLREGKTPYTREARVITKILTMNLNRTQFQKEVNGWLEKHQRERVEWGKLEFTRKAA